MKKIVYIIILLTVTSCTQHDGVESLDWDYSDLTSIQLSTDAVIESSIIVSFFNNNIIIRHYLNDIFTMYRYDSVQGSVQQMGSFAKMGNGPNEFSGAVEIHYNNSNNNLYLFDIRGGNNVQSYQVNLSSSENIFNTSRWKPVSFPNLEKSFYSTFLPLSDSVLVGLGGNYDQSNLLSTINLYNSQVKNLNIDLPNDGINVKPSVKRYIYNYGRVLKQPSTNKFLYYCTNWGNYADIFTLENEQVKNVKPLITTFPIYKVATDGRNSESDRKTLMGMEAYATDKYIYLLPSSLTKEEYLKKDPNRKYPTDHLNEIYVYDWEGNPVKAYKLDKPIAEFVVDPDDTYLLGSSVDTESGDIVFVRFDLK